MKQGLLNKLLKKGFSVELEKCPASKEEFLMEIERYCIRENANFAFITRDRPAVISIDGIVYECTLWNAGRPGFVLRFKEI